MTEDKSENLRKFLKSDDIAIIRMGLSMAKGSEIPNDLLGEILWMYMVHWGGPLVEERKVGGGSNLRLRFLVNVARQLGNLGDIQAINSLIKAQKIGINIKNKDFGLESLHSTAKEALEKLGHKTDE